MKKILFLLIIVLTIFGCNCAFAETNPQIYFYEYPFDETEIVIYSNVKSSDYDLLAIAYNGNNIVGVEIVDLNLYARNNYIETDIDWSDTNFDRARFFVWKGISPVCKSAEMFTLEGVITETPHTYIAKEEVYDEF